MADEMRFVREQAPDDVTETLDWLLAHGFEVSGGHGGADESFGNVALELSDGHIEAVLVRDRGQWALDIAPPGAGLIGLHILQTAAFPDVYPPQTISPRDLPTQLPPDSVWAVLVPQIVDWLRAGDRSAAIDEAQAAWRREMERHLGG